MSKKLKFDPHTGELKPEKKGCFKIFFKIILWLVVIWIVIVIIANIFS
jgi:hypothetical protein